MVGYLVETPTLLTLAGCRMMYHMKTIGAKSLQQVEGQSFCGPKSTLTPIQFAEFTKQSSSFTKPHEVELYTRSGLDTGTLA